MLKTTLKAVLIEGVIVILAIGLLTSNFPMLFISNMPPLPIEANTGTCTDTTVYQRMFADLVWTLRYTLVCKTDV